MEVIIDASRVGKHFAHSRHERLSHVCSNRFDPCAISPEPTQERFDSVGGFPLRDVNGHAGVQIKHNADISIPLPDGQFVDADASDFAYVHSPRIPRQLPALNLVYRLWICAKDSFSCLTAPHALQLEAPRLVLQPRTSRSSRNEAEPTSRGTPDE